MIRMPYLVLILISEMKNLKKNIIRTPQLKYFEKEIYID
tara:strand:- start:1285 stop:1401 length:117 start_codon:yes stop_codon:yes gene_type:complete